MYYLFIIITGIQKDAQIETLMIQSKDKDSLIIEKYVDTKAILFTPLKNLMVMGRVCKATGFNMSILNSMQYFS
jgi:hypothetical protein